MVERDAVKVCVSSGELIPGCTSGLWTTSLMNSKTAAWARF